VNSLACHIYDYHNAKDWNSLKPHL